MNKKGAEMTIGTIIIIVLALVVLVVLIYGFSSGWTNLWEKITGFGGGKNNVQSIVQSCQLACTTGSKYDWCLKSRNIVTDDGPLVGITTGEGLSKKQNYGLEAGCGAIKCDNPINCLALDSVRNTLLIIEGDVTGCPANSKPIPSADTVAPGQGVKPAVCCQSTFSAEKITACAAIKTNTNNECSGSTVSCSWSGVAPNQKCIPA